MNVLNATKLHLKVVKTINFMLCVFYHCLKKKKTRLENKKQYILDHLVSGPFWAVPLRITFELMLQLVPGSPTLAALDGKECLAGCDMARPSKGQAMVLLRAESHLQSSPISLGLYGKWHQGLPAAHPKWQLMTHLSQRLKLSISVSFVLKFVCY